MRTVFNLDYSYLYTWKYENARFKEHNFSKLDNLFITFAIIIKMFIIKKKFIFIIRTFAPKKMANAKQLSQFKIKEYAPPHEKNTCHKISLILVNLV